MIGVTGFSLAVVQKTEYSSLSNPQDAGVNERATLSRRTANSLSSNAALLEKCYYDVALLSLTIEGNEIAQGVLKVTSSDTVCCQHWFQMCPTVSL